MKSNNLIHWIFFCFLLLWCEPTAATNITPQEAEKFASVQGNELLKAFSEQDLSIKYKKLDNMFLNSVDLDYIAKFVVGKYWRNMTASQRQKYTDLFKRYVMNTYKGFPLQFDNRVSFKITGSRAEKENMFVIADIHYRGDEKTDTFTVEFRMHKPKNRILITDIKIGESSLLVSYRSKFYQMIKDDEEDMEWFLEDFELSVTSAEKHYALPD